jgi:hypothetical protein
MHSECDELGRNDLACSPPSQIAHERARLYRIIDSLQDVIRAISISMYPSPLEVKGITSSPGMLAMTTRIRGMSANPTISARAGLIETGVPGTGIVIMGKPFCRCRLL